MTAFEIAYRKAEIERAERGAAKRQNTICPYALKLRLALLFALMAEGMSYKKATEI